MERGAWWAIVHGITELDMIEQLSRAHHTLEQFHLYPYDNLLGF